MTEVAMGRDEAVQQAILTPERLAEIEARAAVEENDESGSIKEQQARKDRTALIASHAALQVEIERLRGQLLVCREAGKMLSGALTSSEDQREATLDRIWDSINAHGGTFEADDLEGKGKCEMIDKALAIIEKEGGVGELQRLSLKTKEEADDE